MLFSCLKCRRTTEIKNSKVVRTRIGRITLLSKCAVCNCKKLKFIKKHRARGLLINFMGIKVPILTDLPILNALF